MKTTKLKTSPSPGEQYYEKQSSTRVDQTNMKLKQELFIDKMKQSANLDPEYYVGYPELQQKLRDHHNLRMLRQKYVHTSHDCGLTASLTNNNLMVYEPYRMSVRDKPSRGEI